MEEHEGGLTRNMVEEKEEEKLERAYEGRKIRARLIELEMEIGKYSIEYVNFFCENETLPLFKILWN